jgi:protein-glutamine gamma-glutamyltransferase-like protein
MARDTDTERQTQPADVAAPDTAPQETTTDTTFTGAGHIPAVDTTAAAGGATASDRAFGAQPQAGGPEIPATKEAMGQVVVNDMKKANVEPGSGGKNDVDHGIHYWYNYQRHCESAGKPELWQDKYRAGHTQSSSFINPHEKGRWMDWELKKGHSASQGIKEWLGGATVAECLSSVIAMEIDALRAAIGDRKFDKMFGSADSKEDKAVPAQQRMHVRAGIQGTPVATYMKSTAVAEEAYANGGQFGSVEDAKLDKELVPGQWYYFYNHPKYLLKHPGGAWQGENALYMGKNEAGERLWSGLGATATEDAMIDEMVRAYNASRNDYDERIMKEQRILGADGEFSDALYDPKSGSFPDKVTKHDILTSQPYSLGGTERKGGFMATAGMELDEKRVQKTRDQE